MCIRDRDTDTDAEHSRRQKDARDATRVVAASSFDGGEKTGASRGPSSHLVSKPLERFEPSESSSDIHGVDDPFDGKRPSRLPALLTSWVSLQPVTLAGGPTVIFPGTHARRHEMRSLSSVQSRTSLRLPSLISRRGSSKRRLTSESPATTQKAMSENSTSGTNSGTGGLSDSRASRKLVNFRTLTWQSSQGESKEDSGPPTF